MEHVYDNIPGWFDFQDVYAQAVRNVPDGGIIVEVGAWFGRSTAFMAVEIANSGKKVQFYTIDTWEGSPDEPDSREIVRQHGGSIYSAFLHNMQAGRVMDRVRPIHLPSKEAAGWFEDGSIDFCFIDAAHDYDSVRNDILAWLPKVKTGGTLAGHDINRYEVRPAVQSVLPWPEVRVEGESWVWTKRPLSDGTLVRHAAGASANTPSFSFSQISLSLPAGGPSAGRIT